MATDRKTNVPPSSVVTREVESRLKQNPEHLFEAFLEIRGPMENEDTEISLKYPIDYSGDLLKTAPMFAYPCRVSDEQGEHFTFIVLDTTGTLFRFGFCRRSNRDATCLCIVSYYPWFETFYTILNDISFLISSKVSPNSSRPSSLTGDAERYLSLLYNYRLMSNAEFFENEGKEIIEISGLPKTYTYNRPDPRKLPSMLSSRNFTVMFSRLGPDILSHLFAHVLLERRILFVSSKLFHLTACVYGCLHLIYPMHWQSLFLPILPASMTWTTQCTTPYIIGIHSSLFSTLNLNELGDVVIVNIDERRLESQHDDLSSFPKYLTRSLKKGIDHSSRLAGDHLARVFLRAMAFAVGNYAAGFTLKNEKLDFDRDQYLEQYRDTHVLPFMTAVSNTQMFEQFSRYRTHAQLQRETDVDEFDLEVKQITKLQQSKKFKTNKKLYKILEKYVKDGTILNSSNAAQKDRLQNKKRPSLIDSKNAREQATNPLLGQVHTKAERLQSAINKAGQRVASEASSMRNNITSLDVSDMLRRTHSSKTSSMDSVHFNTEKSSHPSSTPDLFTQKFDSEENGLSSKPRLINSDQVSSASSMESSRSSTPDPEQQQERENEQQNLAPLINFDSEENPLLPSPIVLNIIHSPASTPAPRPVLQIDSKIKQLQSELQFKVQIFDGKRFDPRDEFGSQQTEIKRLVKQFDPLNDPNYSNNPPRQLPPPTMTMSTPNTASYEEKDKDDEINDD